MSGLAGVEFDRSALRAAAPAGFLGAAATGALLLGWSRFATWYITGSGFTDLPGQDSLALVNAIEPLVYGVIAIVAGRVVALLHGRPTWIAVLIAAVPLNAFFLFSGAEHGPIRALVACIIVYSLALGGAYGPGLLRRGERRGRPTRS